MFSQCVCVCVLCFVDLQTNTKYFFCKFLRVWFFFSSSAFIFIFFGCSVITQKLFFSLARFSPKLQLLEACTFSVCFRAKKSEPSCPDTQDMKLQIACYLFLLLLFLESRELQKNTQIVWRTFDVTGDKYRRRDVKSWYERHGKGLTIYSVYVIYGKIVSLCFEMSLDLISNISELTFWKDFLRLTQKMMTVGMETVRVFWSFWQSVSCLNYHKIQFLAMWFF